MSVALTLFVSPQRGVSDVSLQDCLDLFTHEEILDGDEQPVSSEPRVPPWFYRGIQGTAVVSRASPRSSHTRHASLCQGPHTMREKVV